MIVSGKPKSHACPFRCYATVDVASAEASLLSMATESQGQSQAQELEESQAPAEESQVMMEDISVDVDEQPILR